MHTSYAEDSDMWPLGDDSAMAVTDGHQAIVATSKRRRVATTHGGHTVTSSAHARACKDYPLVDASEYVHMLGIQHAAQGPALHRVPIARRDGAVCPGLFVLPGCIGTADAERMCACRYSEDATCRRSWTGLKLDCISQKCYFGTVEGMGIFDSKYKDAWGRGWGRSTRFNSVPTPP